MTRTRLAVPSLPVFLLAATVVALLAFGTTRWITDRAAADTLPALELASGDRAAAAPGALDPNKLFTARVDTTVSVTATIGDAPMNGSGVVVDPRGYLVTSSHVVKDYGKGLDAAQVFVRFHKGDEVAAEVVATDQMFDLAILRIDPAQLTFELEAAPLADSDTVLVGTPVMAIGAPFDYEFSSTLGNVSAVHRNINSEINANSRIPDAIQHDAAINTGNSGGPIFNARGQVIGINQQIATPAKVNSGVSFAVSSNIVRRALEQHLKTSTPSIRYADLGIIARTVSPQLAEQARLDAPRGALVQSATGPARDAGIGVGQSFSFLGRTVVRGDHVIAVGGREVNSAEDLYRAQMLLDPAAPTTVTVLRGGEPVEVSIRPLARAL